LRGFAFTTISKSWPSAVLDFYGRVEEFLAKHLEGRAEPWKQVPGTSARQHLDPEASARRPHSLIEGEQGEARHGAASHQDAREVQGVERTDWLARKRPACALDHLGVQPQEIPRSGGGNETAPEIGGLALGNAAGDLGAVDRTVAFYERQVRGEHQLGRRENRADCLTLRLAEQPG
jgi:hypothetical protein